MRPRRAEKRPQRHHRLHIKGEEPPRLIQSQPCLGKALPRLGVGGEGLAAGGLPMHRPPGHGGGSQQRDMLRIGRRLQAKGAADIGGEHPQIRPGDASQRIAQEARPLAGGAQHRPAILGDPGSGVARLHRHAGDAGLGKAKMNNMRRAGQNLGHLRISKTLPVAGEIARRLRPKLRRPRGKRGARLHRRGQGDEFNGDQLRRVLRLGKCFRHHQGDGLANMQHPAIGQGRPGRHHQPRHRHGPGDVIGGDIAGQQHRQHTRRGPGGGDVQRRDAGMGMGAAQEAGGRRPSGLVSSVKLPRPVSRRRSSTRLTQHLCWGPTWRRCDGAVA